MRRWPAGPTAWRGRRRRWTMSMPAERRAMALLLGLAACAGGRGESMDGGTPPPGYATQQLLGHTLVVPAGFAVSVFAGRDGGVRLMFLSPRPAVYPTH